MKTKQCFFVIFSFLSIFFAGCGGDTNNTKVSDWELNELNENDYNIKKENINFIANDYEGDKIYVSSREAVAPRVLSVGDGTWKDAADWSALRWANSEDKGNASSANARITALFPSYNGAIGLINGVHAVIFSHHTAAAYRSFPTQHKDAYYNLSLFVAKKDNAKYLYAPLITGFSVPFRPYVNPSNIDLKLWDFSLKKTALQNLEQPYPVLAQDHEGNLLLAARDGISRLKKDDIGEPNKYLDNNGAPIYTIDKFQLNEKGQNQNISAMAMAGNYLLVGFNSNDQAELGGLFWADISKGIPEKWQSYHEKSEHGLTINQIAVDPSNKSRAYIATTKGFLIFENNDLVEPISGKGKLLNQALSEIKKTDVAVGFTNAFSTMPGYIHSSIAVDNKGVAYLLIYNVGIYTLKKLTK